MSTLQDLCLNMIETNGTSVTELVKDVVVPKEIAHRHPVLQIITLNNFPPEKVNYITSSDLLSTNFVIMSTITITFDGVYTVKWSRDIYDFDDLELSSVDRAALRENETFKTRMAITTVFLKERHPQFLIWSGALKPKLKEDWFLPEITELIVGCNYFLASIITPSGENMMDVVVCDKSLHKDADCSQCVYALTDALSLIRKLAMCY